MTLYYRYQCLVSITIKIFNCVVFVFFNTDVFAQSSKFDYNHYLFGTPSTLSVTILSVDTNTGNIKITGADNRTPSDPFTWNWGDGSVISGFFPQSHIYTNIQKNYVVKVIANYSDGTKDSSEVLVRFIAPTITPIEIPDWLAVKIPENTISLNTRLYEPPDHLTAFNDSFFITVPRATIEYVLSVCATIENDFTNNNIFLYSDKFEQIMLLDTTFEGAYSLWFTNPVAFVASEEFLRGSVDFSSLFHEMGHNFTLNTPSNYYYGGKIDGEANTIYSESMANIFQHAAGYEVINNYQSYGLSDDLMFEIRQSMISSISIVRDGYEDYLSEGKHFVSWDDPNTQDDETFNIFMTIAYKFLEKAETNNVGYKGPLKKMLSLLQGFKPDWRDRFDQSNNTAEADTFRATLMVAAISFAFSTDLRDEFRILDFPISDTIYDEIYNSVTSVEGDNNFTEPLTFNLNQNYPNPFNSMTRIEFFVPQPAFVTLKIYDTLGREVMTLFSEETTGGSHSVMWDASKFSSGVYYYRLSADGLLKTKQLLILK